MADETPGAPSWANFRADVAPSGWEPEDAAPRLPRGFKPVLIRIGSARIKAAAVIIGMFVLAAVVPSEDWNGLLILGLIAVAYFLPTIIAASLKSHMLGPVAVVNFFLGWTFIGWVGALAMSVVRPRP